MPNAFIGAVGVHCIVSKCSLSTTPCVSKTSIENLNHGIFTKKYGSKTALSSAHMLLTVIVCILLYRMAHHACTFKKIIFPFIFSANVHLVTKTNIYNMSL